jgi:hypothetical protein
MNPERTIRDPTNLSRMAMSVDTDNPSPPIPNGRSVGPQPSRRGMEIFFFLGVFALWIILQVWVLPKLGVPT